VFQHQWDYDRHLSSSSWCRCGKEFSSEHDWLIHKKGNPYADCGTAKSEDFDKVLIYFKDLGEIELNTPSFLIVRLKQEVNIDQIKAIWPDLNITINEGKIIVDYVNRPKSRKRKPRTLGKQTGDRAREEDKSPVYEEDTSTDVYAKYDIF
jgi:hypothetical protein